MRLLLDTHVLLWVMADDPALTAGARTLIRRADQVFVSSVSIWEVNIKASLGKLRFNQERFLEALDATGFAPLPITWEHADALRQLPDIHRDPFDRMLVAQALSEPLRLLTADGLLARYTDLVIRV